jgi:hypothetical protein
MQSLSIFRAMKGICFEFTSFSWFWILENQNLQTGRGPLVNACTSDRALMPLRSRPPRFTVTHRFSHRHIRAHVCPVEKPYSTFASTCAHLTLCSLLRSVPRCAMPLLPTALSPMSCQRAPPQAAPTSILVHCHHPRAVPSLEWPPTKDRPRAPMLSTPSAAGSPPSPDFSSRSPAQPPGPQASPNRQVHPRQLPLPLWLLPRPLTGVPSTMSCAAMEPHLQQVVPPPDAQIEFLKPPACSSHRPRTPSRRWSSESGRRHHRGQGNSPPVFLSYMFLCQNHVLIVCMT